MDDDDIIECDNDHAHIDYMNELDKHPQGFAIIKKQEKEKSAWFEEYPYKKAPLNLCAVSRFIYEKEDIPDTEFFFTLIVKIFLYLLGVVI